eukprot:g11729.t1
MSAELDKEKEEVIALLGPRWQAMCRSNDSTTFLWSHNGKTKSGWIQLLPNKKLSTTWCLGTWEVLANNPDVVDMNFGTSRHLCHYKEGGFVVEQKYNVRTLTGKESYKPGKPKSCGFVTRNDQRGHRGVPGEKGYKALGGKRKEMNEDEEAEARACDWRSKRARCFASVPWAPPVEPTDVLAEADQLDDAPSRAPLTDAPSRAGSVDDALPPFEEREKASGRAAEEESGGSAKEVGLPLSLNGRNDLEERPTYVFENGAAYTGHWSGQQREGYGVQVWPDGARYEGNWKADKAQGWGRFAHADGDVYEGEWVADTAHGQGTYHHSDGSQYEGHWEHDRQHGHGIELWADGARYEGNYASGKKHGPGYFSWADGSTYDGEFLKLGPESGACYAKALSGVE